MTGYRVTLYDDTTKQSTETVLPKNTMRLPSPIPADGDHYVRVVALLDSGRVLDGGWIFVPAQSAPPPLAGVRATITQRTATTITARVTWTPPKDPVKYANSTLYYGDVPGHVFKWKTVNAATGNTTVVLPARLQDADLQFELETAMNDFAASSRTVIKSSSPAFLASTRGVGQKVTVTYLLNPSWRARTKATTGTPFTLQVRPKGKTSPVSAFAGKAVLDSENYSLDDGSSGVVLRARVTLPKGALARPEFRVGVRVNGKTVWTPWRTAL